jgi:hypothetical protein
MPGVQKPHWLEERLLERVEVTVDGETLDGRHRLPARLQREVRARVHGAAVDEHHARSALGVVAPLLRPGEPELVA